MPYNNVIRQLTVDDKNHADIFNAVITKLLENTDYNKRKIEELTIQLQEVLNQFSGYLTTEELITLLEKGIKGDPGKDGITYTFTFDDLTDEQKATIKGEKGDPGVPGKNGEPGIPGKDGLTTSITVNGKTYTQVEGNILLPEYPTALPASDVYAWAKASTKPSYTASEVGALGANETAVNAAKVNNLTVLTAVPANAKFTDTTYGLATTTANGLMSAAQVTSLNTAVTDIASLKTTSVNGKSTVATAINGVLGTSLTSATSYADMAYYIGTMAKKLSISSMSDLGATTNSFSGYLVYIIVLTDKDTNTMELIIYGNYYMTLLKKDGSVSTSQGTSYDIYHTDTSAFIIFTDLTTSVRTKNSYRYHMFGLK